jgi:hypothetical protein
MAAAIQMIIARATLLLVQLMTVCVDLMHLEGYGNTMTYNYISSGRMAVHDKNTVNDSSASNFLYSWPLPLLDAYLVSVDVSVGLVS